MIEFFQKIIDVLDEEKIPYMLSGSVAMSLYIVPRATRDFDFVIFLQPKNIRNFVNHFQEGYYCNIIAIEDALKHESMFNIIDHNSGFKADFVILKNEDFRQVEFSRKITLEYFGKKISVVSVEDLLISKLIWIQDFNSNIQEEDIRNLSEYENLDNEYIQKWIKKLRLKTFDLI